MKIIIGSNVKLEGKKTMTNYCLSKDILLDEKKGGNYEKN